jgi:molybdenum cofactor biosynthesis protein B
MVDFQSRDTSRGIDDGDDEDDEDDEDEVERADGETPDSEDGVEADEQERSDTEPEGREETVADDRGTTPAGSDDDIAVEDPVEKARAATQDDHATGTASDPLAPDSETEQTVDEPADPGTESKPPTTDPLAGDDADSVGDGHAPEAHEARESESDHSTVERDTDEHDAHTGHEHDRHASHTDHDGHDHSHGHDATATQVGVAVVTVSSTRTREDDPSGDIVETTLANAGHDIVTRDVIRDDLDGIQNVVVALTDRSDVDAVVTTGGTGITPDDVTVEAVSPLFDKELPGFGELFRILSYEDVGTKALASRATAGVVDGSVVFCLPGSEAAATLGVEELIAEEIGHLVGLAQRDE